jgi:isoamylase
MDTTSASDEDRRWATDDLSVLELRARQRRNLLATLLLSEGLPVLLGGDELGRTQRGNNNAYCQDNEISLVDWAQADGALCEVMRVCRQRREHERLPPHALVRHRRVALAGPGRAAMEAADWSNTAGPAVAYLAIPVRPRARLRAGARVRR